MDDYIPKPVNLKTLESTVLKWFRLTHEDAPEASPAANPEVIVVSSDAIAPSEDS